MLLLENISKIGRPVLAALGVNGLTYPGQKLWFWIIPIYWNVNDITQILVTSITFAWSLFVWGKQGFLYFKTLKRTIEWNFPRSEISNYRFLQKCTLYYVRIHYLVIGRLFTLLHEFLNLFSFLQLRIPLQILSSEYYQYQPDHSSNPSAIWRKSVDCICDWPTWSLGLKKEIVCFL